MANTEEVNIALVVEDKGASTTLDQLFKASKKLKDELAELEKGTESYTAKLQELGLLGHQLKQTNNDVESSVFNVSDAFNTLNTAGGILVDGLTSLQLAGSLLGIENETLRGTLEKLKTAMSLVKSLQSLHTGFSSLKSLVPIINTGFAALNKTLLANPILLVAMAIITLLRLFGDWDTIMETIKEVLGELWDGVKDLGKGIKGLMDKFIGLFPFLEDTEDLFTKIKAGVTGLITAFIKFHTGPLRAIVKLMKGDFKGALESLKDGFNVVGNTIDGFNRSIDRTKVVLEKSKHSLDKDTASVNNNRKAYDEAAAARIKAEEDIAKALKDLYSEEEADRISRLSTEDIAAEVAEQEALVQRLIAMVKGETDNWEEQAEAARLLAAERERLNQLKSAQVTIDAAQAEVDAASLELQRRITEAEDAYNESLASGNQLLKAHEKELAFNNLSKAEQLELLVKEDELLMEQSQNRVDEINAELLATELSEERQAELREERLLALADLQAAELSYTKNNAALVRQREDDDKEEQEKRKKNREENLKNLRTCLTVAAGFLGDHTVAGKAAAVAFATMDTYAAAQKAYLSQLIPGDPTSLPRAKFAFATAIIQGLANVKNILAVKTPGGSGSSGGAVSSASAPSLASFPEQTTPIVETHNNTTAYEEDNLNRPTTVLVVEDMNQAQHKVNVAERQSTFA